MKELNSLSEALVSTAISNGAYQKPEIVAENKAEGTFAAACPPQSQGSAPCSSCETVV